MNFKIDIQCNEHDRERRKRMLSDFVSAMERGGTEEATETLSTTMADFEEKFEIVLSQLRDEL